MKIQQLNPRLRKGIASIIIILLCGYLGIAQTNICDSTDIQATATNQLQEELINVNSDKTKPNYELLTTELLAVNHTHTSSNIAKKITEQQTPSSDQVIDNSFLVDSEEEMIMEDWMLNISNWTN